MRKSDAIVQFVDNTQDLIAGYRRFRAGPYLEAANLFKRLGRSQTPATMIIACADSRADPSMIFDAAPGELFVVRNVGALVPPFDTSPGLHGVSAALEFAVTSLKVRQILVMGHGGCGGMAACLAATMDRPVGRFIAPWVEIAAPVRDAVIANHAIPDQDQLEALEHGAVGLSIENLNTFPFVREAIENGELSIDGAWFSIGRGELHLRDRSTGRFEIIQTEET